MTRTGEDANEGGRKLKRILEKRKRLQTFAETRDFERK